jgi:hypothetical protein
MRNKKAKQLRRRATQIWEDSQVMLKSTERPFSYSLEKHKNGKVTVRCSRGTHRRIYQTLKKLYTRDKVSFNGTSVAS